MQSNNIHHAYVVLSDGNFIWEEGANSFQPNQRILSVARDLGLLPDLVLADPNLPRYIFWNNTLHPLPMSLRQLIESKLLSFKGKLALMLGVLGLVSPEPREEESIRDFAVRHFGGSFCPTCYHMDKNGTFSRYITPWLPLIPTLLSLPIASFTHVCVCVCCACGPGGGDRLGGLRSYCGSLCVGGLCG